MDRFDVDSFVARQLESWPMARANYEALARVRRREFDMGGYAIALQFNPARKVSTGANLSSQSIAQRPCFLCEHNRPQEQMIWPFDADFSILVNPFPIFPRHLTIVLNRHEPQHVFPYLKQMRRLARIMPQMVVFFNGAHSGASAPDHMHFQASEAKYWPFLADYEKGQHENVALTGVDASVDCSTSIGRVIYKVSSASDDMLEPVLRGILALHDREDDMLNLMMHGDDMYVVPRKAFRPWQYAAAGEEQLMVSPASVEVGGLFVTPVEEHFDKMTADDIKSILSQVCFA